MICSTTRLTLILSTLALVACAKSGISQDPVAVLDNPVVSQAYTSDIFFPYQQPTDYFTQSSLVANPNDPAKFTLTYAPRDTQPTMIVKVNGNVVTSGFTLTSSQLVFQPQPAPNAKITVTYDVQNPNDVMNPQLVLIPSDIDLQTLRIALNGSVVPISNLGISLSSSSDYYVFDPRAVLFNYDDPYQIYSRKGLDVFVSGTVNTVGN